MKPWIYWVSGTLLVMVAIILSVLFLVPGTQRKEISIQDGTRKVQFASPLEQVKIMSPENSATAVVLPPMDSKPKKSALKAKPSKTTSSSSPPVVPSIALPRVPTPPPISPPPVSPAPLAPSLPTLKYIPLSGSSSSTPRSISWLEDELLVGYPLENKLSILDKDGLLNESVTKDESPLQQTGAYMTGPIVVAPQYRDKLLTPQGRLYQWNGIDLRTVKLPGSPVLLSQGPSVYYNYPFLYVTSQSKQVHIYKTAGYAEGLWMPVQTIDPPEFMLEDEETSVFGAHVTVEPDDLVMAVSGLQDDIWIYQRKSIDDPWTPIQHLPNVGKIKSMDLSLKGKHLAVLVHQQEWFSTLQVYDWLTDSFKIQLSEGSAGYKVKWYQDKLLVLSGSTLSTREMDSSTFQFKQVSQVVLSGRGLDMAVSDQGFVVLTESELVMAY